jgi:hypothetical protein
MAIEPDHAAAGGFWNALSKRWEWYDELGQWHRVAGPAVICPDGRQWWYLHNVRHRVDGPAMIDPDGTQAWWQHGRRHRAAGPALTYPNGDRYWMVQGNDITEAVEDWMRDNDVTWPFTESQQMEFALRWL